jgi:hypothetical protein
MPDYIVNVREVHIQPYKVTADDPEAAKGIIVADGGDIMEDMIEFSHRLDREYWTVDLVEDRKKPNNK